KLPSPIAWMSPLERVVLRLSGGEFRPQSWREYTRSILIFSLLGVLISDVLLRAQNWLPLNPQHFPSVGAALSFNTAVRFVTNTNWQAYSGESTMSYFSQLMALTWHNFTSAAVGIAVAIAVSRGMTRRHRDDAPATLGNFYIDVVRIIIYILLPACVLI